MTVTRTLTVEAACSTLDEALTLAVQFLDTHRYAAAPGYRIEITGSVVEGEDGEEQPYYEVMVQGVLLDDPPAESRYL